MLENDPLLEELWGDDLHLVPMDWSRSRVGADPSVEELARRLDQVLDRICLEAADVSSFLLDETYSNMLRPDEREVQRLLSEALEVADGSSSPTLQHVVRLLESLGG